MADLHCAISGFLVGCAHALGVVDGEGHRLFLVDMLAGFEGVGKVLAVEVLRRGDQHGVERFVFEKIAMIEIRFSVWGKLLGGFQARRVDVGEGRNFDIRTSYGVARNFRAAGAYADDPDADTIICAQDFAWGCHYRQAGCYITDEITPGTH